MTRLALVVLLALSLAACAWGPMLPTAAGHVTPPAIASYIAPPPPSLTIEVPPRHAGPRPQGEQGGVRAVMTTSKQTKIDLARRDGRIGEAVFQSPRDMRAPGTVEWAIQTAGWFKSVWTSRQASERRWLEAWQEVTEYEVWKLVPPDEPYGSLDAMLADLIGISLAEIRKRFPNTPTPGETIVAAPNEVGPGQGTRTDLAGEDELPSNGRKLKEGNSATYLAARLKRDHPELAERVLAGEFASIRAAALEAGIVKPRLQSRPISTPWPRTCGANRGHIVRQNGQDTLARRAQPPCCAAHMTANVRYLAQPRPGRRGRAGRRRLPLGVEDRRGAPHAGARGARLAGASGERG